MSTEKYDADDTPELGDAFFARAEIRKGDEVMRPASGTLTRTAEGVMIEDLEKVIADGNPIAIAGQSVISLPAVLRQLEQAQRMREALEKIAKDNVLGTPTLCAGIAKDALEDVQ